MEVVCADKTKMVVLGKISAISIDDTLSCSINFVRTIYATHRRKRKGDPMSVWAAIGIVCLAGAIGGLINSFTSTDSPRTPTTEAGVFLPGFISHVFLGAAAAGLSWALYGPAGQATVAVIGSPSAQGAQNQTFSLTLAALAGAVLVGIGGANWIANEVNKRATTAAAKKIIDSKKGATPDQREKFNNMLATPVEALAFAKAI